MQKLTKTVLGLLGAMLIAPQAMAAPATYAFDPTHTAVTWSISHFGFSHPSGKFMSVEGAIMLDEAKPEDSSVEATITIKGLLTGVPKLDEHLLGDGFFDVEHFPTATFKSTSVKLTSKDDADVSGQLTIHGVAKPATLKVHLNKIGDNIMQKKTAGFTASMNLKRSDFGMTAYLPGLGDDVAITIETEANFVPPSAPNNLAH